MAFQSATPWPDRSRMPVAGIIANDSVAWAWLVAKAGETVPRKAVSLSLALVCAYATFSALTFSGQISLASDHSDAIEAIFLTPTRERPPREPAAAGAPGTPQIVTTPGSIVDVSTVTPLTNPEWTVSKIRLRTPVSRPSARRLTGAALGIAAGTGGSGVYDPYAGASPLRMPTDASAERTAIAAEAMDLLRRDANAAGLTLNGQNCEAIIALTGVVLDVSCRSLGGDPTPALTNLLRSRQLYGPAGTVRRVRIDFEQ